MTVGKKTLALKTAPSVQVTDQSNLGSGPTITLKPKIELKPNIILKKGITLGEKAADDDGISLLSGLEGSSIEDIYQQMEHRKQILQDPGMYVGSVKSDEQLMFVYDDETKQMVKKNIKFVPGLYKIFDEGIVNMRDQNQRMLATIAQQADIIAGKLPPNKKIDINRKYRPVKKIEVSIDMEKNTVTLRNDGDGVDVAWHNKAKMYVPELIFGNLLSGTNYDKSEKKTVGGKHGYGAKLMNILSTEFIIETVDAHRGLKYTQRFFNNMADKEDPVIVPCKSAPYTQFIFKPDFPRFGLTSFADDDTVQLMRKRTYDIAACTSKDVNVYYNGEKLDVKTFERYVDMYIGSRGQCKRLYSTINEDWEIAVCASPDDSFEQVSFVNGICTYKGGKHVDHVATIISGRLAKYAVENKKGMSGLTPKHIKDNLWIFINSTMVNPDFDTQTKENFTTNVSDFRNRCDIPDDFIEKLAQPKMGILDKAIKLSLFKAGNGLKRSDGKKNKRVKNEKAIHAYYAGDGKRAQKCTLILTEGDSAQTFAVSGLAAFSEEMRKYYGVMPLKGKMINPKDCKVSTIEDNQQFIEIKQMLGLKQGADYSKSIASLRYGSVMIITDADVDGDHIKGLVFNLFHEFWPSLLKYPDFFKSLLTPIVKARRKATDPLIITHSFYSLAEFQTWKQANEKTLKQWEIKYYKGLGTHEASEARECFTAMKVQVYSWDDLSRMKERSQQSLADNSSIIDNKTLPASSEESTLSSETEITKKSDETMSTYTDASLVGNLESFKNYYKTPNKHPCDLAMQLAFAKKFADYRKGWITEYLQLKSLGKTDQDLHKLQTMSYFDFINEKFIDFSVDDNERSIPSIMDGLKPGQRKIMYAVFRRRLRKEIKVAQFTGYIAEHTCYHHGEDSLNKTIIGLAQDYPGSNNINLLTPKGQFGTRFQNGADHASPRYIFTCMNPLTEIIFNKIDENLYEYIDDDGVLVEPKYYAPTLCLVLINGARGIGTGWSTDIPCFNPIDIIENIKRYLDGQPMKEMTPWYRGFRGTIVKMSHQKYKVTGVYNRTSQTTVEITELPIGSARSSQSFKDYKNYIESLIIDDSVTDEKEKSKQILEDADILVSDTSIKCILHFPSKEKLNELMSNLDAFEKILQITHSLSTSNMNLFNIDGIMTKYVNAEDILAEYCKYRLQIYEDRKKYMIGEIESDILKISEKIRFITYFNDENHPVKLQKKETEEVIARLEEYNFARFERKAKKKTSTTAINNDDDSETEENSEIEAEESLDENDEVYDHSYDYLLLLPITSLTIPRMKKLMKEKERLIDRLNQLKITTIQQLWEADISKFNTELAKYEKNWNIKYEEILKLPKGIPRIPNHLKTKISLKSKIQITMPITINNSNKIILKKKC